MMHNPHFNRDMRRLRSALIVGLSLIMLLPWLFVQSSVSCNQWNGCKRDNPNEERLPEPSPEAVPVPETYSTVVTYVQIPEATVSAWITKHYPDSLVNTPSDLGQIALAAKHYNVSEFILLGILGAEQGFVSPSATGIGHALWALGNPFDYGVWPGSPFKQDIGVYQSALGTASLVARVAEGFQPGTWDKTQLTEFFMALSGWFANGNVDKVDLSWMHNVTTFDGEITVFVASNVTAFLRNLIQLLPPVVVAMLLIKLAHDMIAFAGRARVATDIVVEEDLVADGVSVEDAVAVAGIAGDLAEGGVALAGLVEAA